MRYLTNARRAHIIINVLAGNVRFNFGIKLQLEIWDFSYADQIHSNTALPI